MMKLGSRAYIIAESGTCHSAPTPAERYDRAERYIAAAFACGASACKFQMFARPLDDVFCRIAGDEAREERWGNSAISLDGWRRLKAFADILGLDLLFSVFQTRTVEWLRALNVKATKVASRASANFPYEDATGTLLISTGMPPYPPAKGILLECESKYPSDRPWRGEYPGFSAHSPTPDLAIDAIKRGCKLVEVHFYIDPSHAGRDLPASLTLDGLRAVCAARDEK